ncbi:Arc family DNA-binding protein [Serratia marcescens]
MSEKPVRDYDKFMLRMPDGMRDMIARMAKQDGRSMNSEILALLELAIKVCCEFGPEDGPVVQQFQNRLNAIDQKQNKIEQSVTLSNEEMSKLVRGISKGVIEQITKDFDLIPKQPSINEGGTILTPNKKPT